MSDIRLTDVRGKEWGVDDEVVWPSVSRSSAYMNYGIVADIQEKEGYGGRTEYSVKIAPLGSGSSWRNRSQRMTTLRSWKNIVKMES